MKITVAVIHFLCVVFSLMADSVTAGDYLDEDGRLTHALVFDSTATGGFAGSIANKFEFATDGEWTLTSQIGGRPATTLTGTLDDQGFKSLDALLAKHGLLNLPEQIGFPKPVDSPRTVADGASTTIVVTFGEKVVTAHTADGLRLPDDQQKMLSALFQMQGELRRLTTGGGAER